MLLTCPVCGSPLTRAEQSAVCANRHCFDYARSGYLNLLRGGGSAHGDNAEMVQARTAFLNTGAYAFLQDAIRTILEEELVFTFADLGCGEGYYTAVCPGEEKYGFDLSRSAVMRASKADRTTQYVIASIFHLPLANHRMDAAMTCFAPAAGDEIARILKPGGRFVFVQPAQDHLYELKEILYEHPYRNEEAMPPLPSVLTLENERIIRQPFEVDHTSLKNLFQMTPYAYKTGRAGAERLDSIQSLVLTASFVIRVYRRSAEAVL